MPKHSLSQLQRVFKCTNFGQNEADHFRPQDNTHTHTLTHMKHLRLCVPWAQHRQMPENQARAVACECECECECVWVTANTLRPIKVE